MKSLIVCVWAGCLSGVIKDEDGFAQMHAIPFPKHSQILLWELLLFCSVCAICDHLCVTLAGSDVSAQQPLHAQRCERTQHTVDRGCSCEAYRLWSVFSPCGNSWPQKYFRWHPILDGSWGNVFSLRPFITFISCLKWNHAFFFNILNLQIKMFIQICNRHFIYW